MKIFHIYTNLLKDTGGETTAYIRNYLEERGCICKDQVDGTVEGIIVLGGDGTMLRAAGEYLGRHIPMIGVNLGTLGYLAEVEQDQIETALDSLIADKYEVEKAEITAIYHENKGRYGYRRITAELRNRNHLLNHKTVQRLMKELGLVCRVRMKKYRSYKGAVGKVAPNLLNRDFHAEKPNQKWVTDVTEFSLFGEKLYLSPILDLCSSDLVSYTISDRPVLSMVTSMLDKAFAKIPDGTGLILHSDQGWHYQHKQYQRMLRKKGILQSMSRKGNCLDNAVIENFFGLLKSELLYLQTFESMEHFKQELVDYLDYYNNRRIKAKLKGLPPALHRQQALSAA